MDEFTITLNSPITEEQWDDIADVDFEHTDRIWFRTKHGKEVEFVKRKTGRWIGRPLAGYCTVRCSVCGDAFCDNDGRWNFCPNCGAKMEAKE